MQEVELGSSLDHTDSLRNVVSGNVADPDQEAGSESESKSVSASKSKGARDPHDSLNSGAMQNQNRAENETRNGGVEGLYANGRRITTTH